MDFKVLIKEGCVPTRYMILAETRDWVGHYADWRRYSNAEAFIEARRSAHYKNEFTALLWGTDAKYGQTRSVGRSKNQATLDLERITKVAGDSLLTLIVLLTDEERVLPCDIAYTAGVYNDDHLLTDHHWAEERDDYLDITEGVNLMVKAFRDKIPNAFKAVEVILKRSAVPVALAVPAPLDRLIIPDPELYDDREAWVCNRKEGSVLQMRSLSTGASIYTQEVLSPWPEIWAQGTKRRPPVRKTEKAKITHVREVHTGRLELGCREFKKGISPRTERLVDYYTGEVLETTTSKGRPDVLYIGTARYHDSRVRTVNEDLDLVTVSDPDLPVGTSVFEPGIPKRTRIVTDWYDDSCELSRTVVYPGMAPIRRVGSLAWPATSSRHIYRLGLEDEATWMSLKGEERAGDYTLSQLFSEAWDKTSPANRVRCIETRWGALTVRELEIDVTYQTAASIESLMIGLAGVFYDNVAPRDLEHCMAASQDLGTKLRHAEEIPLAVKSQIESTQLCIYRRDEGGTQRLVLALTSRVPDGAVVYSTVKSHWSSDLRELRSEMGLGWVREDTADLMEQIAPLHEKMGIELQNDFVPSGRGIYAAYFHGKEPGDGIIKLGRSKDIRQRICKYEQGGSDMPPECEGMMTVLGWVYTDIDGADNDANEWINWCSEDKVKALADSNELSLVRTHNEYYWCDDPLLAKNLADQILDEIRKMTTSDALGMRYPYDLVNFCRDRHLDTLHFLQHLQDLGVDEAYLNKVRRTYANRLAKAQNSD